MQQNANQQQICKKIESVLHCGRLYHMVQENANSCSTTICNLQKQRTITKQDHPLHLTVQQSAKNRDQRQKTKARSWIGNTKGSLSMFVLFAICYNNKIRYFFSRCGIYIPHADATWEMPENSGFYRLLSHWCWGLDTRSLQV